MNTGNECAPDNNRICSVDIWTELFHTQHGYMRYVGPPFVEAVGGVMIYVGDNKYDIEELYARLYYDGMILASGRPCGNDFFILYNALLYAKRRVLDYVARLEG